MKIPVEWLKEYVKINKSEKEIADSFTLLGLMLDKPIKDGVLDLEHRMDRSDWLSVLGCARDLAAFEGLKLEYPKLHIKEGKKPKEIVKIEVKCPDKVLRFNTRVFRGVKVKPSPEWLKNRLESYGIPSINNIVDITNYVMVEYGQPMHAQDLNKMEKQEIVIRDAKKDESVLTLLGETVPLTPEAFVLTQDDKASVIGGIVGGKATAVTSDTTDIILDAGNYNQNVIRKVSRKLKIQNETVLRYDKFLHPDLTEIALERATYLILELAGGEYYENVDWYPTKAKTKSQKLSFARVKQLSGLDISKEKIKQILTDLEYKITDETKDGLTAEVPFFRTDVEVEDDLVADVLRINNYENIPIQLIEAAPPVNITPSIYLFEEKLKDICVNLGLHEYITDPVVQKNEKTKGQVVLENALTSEKSALRTTLKETLLPVLTTYKKQKIKEIGIFEIAKVYSIEGPKDKYGSYKEQRVLEILYKNEGFPLRESANKLKSILATILSEVGILWEDLEKVGKITPDSIQLDTEKMLELANPQANADKIISEIKNLTTEDISIIMDKNTKFGRIYEKLKKCDENILEIEVKEEREMPEEKKSILLKITYTTSETFKTRALIINELRNHQVEVRK